MRNEHSSTSQIANRALRSGDLSTHPGEEVNGNRGLSQDT